MQSKTHKRLATVFAHFDADNRIDEACLHYLTELQKISDVLIFISTSVLSEIEQRKALAFCTELHCKQNKGLDFCSYKLGLKKINLEEFDTILLANDSVYGPIYPLSDIVNAFYASKKDVYGATFSFDPKPHIQSYFMLFNKKAFSHSKFKTFWNNVQPLENKKDIIHQYEIGISQLLSANGLRLGALYAKQYSRIWQLCLMIMNSKKEYRLWRLKMGILKLKDHKPLGFNPSHFLAWQLIQQYKVPFIKKELIHKNPAFVNINKLKTLKNNNRF